jgi:protein-S-isoprenylcysteine O-methyltransferase Ste14
MAFGIITHAVFAVTVWRLFWFLADTAAGGQRGSLWLNVLWAVGFVVPHSALLLPAVRNRLEAFVPSPHYGCFFCLTTCLALLVLITQWRASDLLLWRITGAPASCIHAAFLASWGMLIYSLSLTGLGYQTGWTPWWHWLRRRPLPRRRFEPRGVYLWIRHPVYLSFLGLIWFTPIMTLDHAVLTGLWTVYIFFGSCLKDRRLTYYLGDRYRRYQAQVAGFPGMWAGPLARVPLDDLAS